jgi:hypothetical protein
LDHLCRRPACVNPDHLDPVAHRVNVIRGAAPAISRARPDARKTCVVDGCSEYRVGRGLCKRHYYQQRRRGWETPVT